jgi:hypothetical protein
MPNQHWWVGILCVLAASCGCADAELVREDPDQEAADQGLPALIMDVFRVEPPLDLGVEADRDASPTPDRCPEGQPLPPIEDRCDWQAPDQPQCPPGYRCELIANTEADRVAVCVAPDCTDVDRDGYGVGDQCAGRDCDDCNETVYEGAAEACNAVDDDCDGAIDETPDPNTIDIRCLDAGVCRGTDPSCRAGQWTCDYPGTYEATETRCDGLDNDCDGRADVFPGVGEPCTAGEGACARDGVGVCDGVSGALRCSATPLEPVAERCNGIDDDCNGVVDDAPGVGEGCTLRSGTCESPGQRLCDPVSARVICNAPEPSPMAEICDGRDNDCDGRLDESLVGCVVEEEERCNNRDDDGDDTIDEGLTQPCESDCGPGVERCVAGVFQACDAPQPVNERCGPADDDCDGNVDEDGVCGVCAGLADGTIIQPGQFGPCGAFSDVCDESGSRQREQTVCQNGVPQQVAQEEPCQRDTDGQACVAQGGAGGRCDGGRCGCTPNWGAWQCDGAQARQRLDGCGGADREVCVAPQTCNGGQCGCTPNWGAWQCDGAQARQRLDGCGGADREVCVAPQTCNGGQCGCTPNWGAWQCDGAQARQRLDGCGGADRQVCVAPQTCNGGQCGCTPNWGAWQCDGAQARQRLDGCGGSERVPCGAQESCNNGVCQCVPNWGAWQCDGLGGRRQADGCGNTRPEACAADSACSNNVCSPCCRMAVSPPVNSWTRDYNAAELCPNIGGGHIYELRAGAIRYEGGADGSPMRAYVDIQVRKFDNSRPSTDITVWVVTSGGGRMRCDDRHAYEHRRWDDNRIVEVVWSRNDAVLTIPRVPIWPSAQCSALRAGDRLKELGIITDDGNHRGQRIWMARETLAFEMSTCR